MISLPLAKGEPEGLSTARPLVLVRAKKKPRLRDRGFDVSENHEP
jgi:hypothetical protein